VWVFSFLSNCLLNKGNNMVLTREENINAASNRRKLCA
jgi:hypothetical protein